MEASSSNRVNYTAYEFSTGDYLELNDLYSSDTSSSSSDNSSYTPKNLDEYIDSYALLRDIGNEIDMNVDEEHINCKFSVFATVQQDNMVINPPSRGFVHCNNLDILVKESLLVDPLPEEDQDLMPDVSVSAAEIVYTGNASLSGTLRKYGQTRFPSLSGTLRKYGQTKVRFQACSKNYARDAPQALMNRRFQSARVPIGKIYQMRRSNCQMDNWWTLSLGSC